MLRFTIEVEREEDGRWIAEVPELPGALAYGPTELDAIVNVKALALQIVADEIVHRERDGNFPSLAFDYAA